MQLAQIWSYIDIDGPNGCWLWHGNFDSNFYGQARIGKGRDAPMHRIHRLVYEHLIGVKPDVCAHSKNCPRNCCNPAHIRSGTQEDNNMGAWSIHKYPIRNTEAARALRTVLRIENLTWHSKYDPKLTAMIAQDRLASDLLRYGDDG